MISRLTMQPFGAKISSLSGKVKWYIDIYNNEYWAYNKFSARIDINRYHSENLKLSKAQRNLLKDLGNPEKMGFGNNLPVSHPFHNLVNWS